MGKKRKKTVKKGVVLAYLVLIMYSHGLATNTTSLARMQVSGFASLTDGDIRAIVGSSMFIDMPCPTDLFLELVHITRLRVLVAERSILPGHTQAIADTIYGAAFFNWANRLMLSIGEPVAPA